MGTDKALKDWEREICDIVDKVAADPGNRLELAEEIIDIVEDLILTAYIRGRGGMKGLAK